MEDFPRSFRRRFVDFFRCKKKPRLTIEESKAAITRFLKSIKTVNTDFGWMEIQWIDEYDCFNQVSIAVTSKERNQKLETKITKSKYGVNTESCEEFVTKHLEYFDRDVEFAKQLWAEDLKKLEEKTKEFVDKNTEEAISDHRTRLAGELHAAFEKLHHSLENSDQSEDGKILVRRYVQTLTRDVQDGVLAMDERNGNVFKNYVPVPRLDGLFWVLEYRVSEDDGYAQVAAETWRNAASEIFVISVEST